MEKTWDEWTDVLGQVYRPGDLVGVAVVNGKSPQLVIGEVKRINRVNSSGEEITTRKWFEHEVPIWKKRTRTVYNYESPGAWRSIGHTQIEEEYEELGEYRTVPSCTVQVVPMIDARGFHRWGTGEDGVNKAVTYRIPENVILIERRGV